MFFQKLNQETDVVCLCRNRGSSKLRNNWTEKWNKSPFLRQIIPGKKNSAPVFMIFTHLHIKHQF